MVKYLVETSLSYLACNFTFQVFSTSRVEGGTVMTTVQVPAIPLEGLKERPSSSHDTVQAAFETKVVVISPPAALISANEG